MTESRGSRSSRSSRISRISGILLAACGSSTPTTTATATAPSSADVAVVVAKPPVGPETACLNGDCANGKGILTRGRGAARAVIDGTFTSGRRTGDGIVYRVAGATFELLELDAASDSATLRHPTFDVVGHYTDDPAPQLSDDSAAVMLPTGEWFFAEWSETKVAARDSHLTGARSFPKLPGDYGDLFAGVTLLEEARSSGRELALRPLGNDTPLATSIELASLVAFVPEANQPVAYIVGIGVVDPEDRGSIAEIRAGKPPGKPITILHADGATSQLELTATGISRYPAWHAPPADWQAVVASELATVEAKRKIARSSLAPGKVARAVVELADAIAAIEHALAVLPGSEAAQISKLRAQRTQLATAHARAQLATRMVELADPTRPEVAAVVDDAIGQITP